jgi:hypothetical protein
LQFNFKKTSGSVLNFFQQTNLILAAGAAMITYQTAFIFVDGERKIILPLFVFFATLLAYSLFRIKIMFKNGERKLPLLSLDASSALRIFTGFISLSFSAVLFFQLKPTVQSLTMLMALATFLYIVPVSINGNPIKGIRNIFILKSTWLALVWTITTVVFPIINSGNVFDLNKYFLICVQRFCFIFSIALAFNIRDYSVDKSKNMKTIPSVWGISAAKIVAFAFLAVAFISVLLEKEISKQTESALFLSLFYTTVLIALAKPVAKNFFYTVLMDGTLAVQALLIFIIC